MKPNVMIEREGQLQEETKIMMKHLPLEKKKKDREKERKQVGDFKVGK